MTPGEYEELEALFQEFLDRPRSEWPQGLETIASPILRARLEHYLENYERLGDFLGEPVFRRRQSLAPGQIVGRFRIGHVLGRGGMGEVFHAMDEKFNAPVAIKSIAPEWLGDPETESHFARETHIGRMVNHPNVCRVFEYLEHDHGDDRMALIVMEYIDGETLADRVLRLGSLEFADAAAILAPVLDGLEAAHRAGVIHRDLKPANVMIEKSGRVVLMDFGLARKLADPSKTVRIRGTASFMAPEQFQGESTPRSDLYSIGMLANFMLTGGRPDANPIPPAWRRPIRVSTSALPSERYASVAELRRAFYPEGVWTRRAWIAASLGAFAASAVAGWRIEHRPFSVVDGAPLALVPVVNRTGDWTLSSLDRVLATQLEQSPRFSVVRAPATPPKYGLELSWEISPRQAGYRLHFRLRSVWNGAAVEHTVEAATRADLFPALYEGAIWVRRTAGDSAMDLAELDLRPEAATTNSWDALMAFTRAEQNFAAHFVDEGIHALDEALRLDPDFAMASMRKADELMALGRDGDALATWARTLEIANRRRATKKELYRIRGMYASDSWNFAEADRVYAEFASYYPHERDAFLFRAYPLLMLDRGLQSISMVRAAFATGRGTTGMFGELALYSAIEKRFAEAHAALSDRLAPASPGAGETLAFIEGRPRDAEIWFAKALARPSEIDKSVARIHHASILAEFGRWDESRALLEKGIEIDFANGLRQQAAQKEMSLLSVILRSDKLESAATPLMDGLKATTMIWPRVESIAALARKGYLKEARSIAEGLPPSSDAPLIAYASARSAGEIDLASGRVAAAHAKLQAAARVMPAGWPREYLAWAYRKSNPAEAAVEYRRASARKGIYFGTTVFSVPGIWADCVAQLKA